VRKQNLNLF